MSVPQQQSTPLLPREKLTAEGPGRLSDQELLSIILGSGTQSCSVYTLSQQVLAVLDNSSTESWPAELTKLTGIGPAKSMLLRASFEFFRRRIRPKGNKISNAENVYKLLRHITDRQQEYFMSVTLNGAHEVISIRTVTVGTLNSSLIHPREVFADAISDRAAAIVVAHNHPSGSLEPSPEDLAVTKRLVEVGTLVGIKLLDHVIISDEGFKSILN